MVLVIIVAVEVLVDALVAAADAAEQFALLCCRC